MPSGDISLTRAPCSSACATASAFCAHNARRSLVLGEEEEGEEEGEVKEGEEKWLKEGSLW